MRTIKVELVSALQDDNPLAAMFGSGNRIHISTEVIVENDAEIREAGREARQAVDTFIEGYGEES